MRSGDKPNQVELQDFFAATAANSTAAATTTATAAANSNVSQAAGDPAAIELQAYVDVLGNPIVINSPEPPAEPVVTVSAAAVVVPSFAAIEAKLAGTKSSYARHGAGPSSSGAAAATPYQPRRSDFDAKALFNSLLAPFQPSPKSSAAAPAASAAATDLKSGGGNDELELRTVIVPMPSFNAIVKQVPNIPNDLLDLYRLALSVPGGNQEKAKDKARREGLNAALLYLAQQNEVITVELLRALISTPAVLQVIAICHTHNIHFNTVRLNQLVQYCQDRPGEDFEPRIDSLANALNLLAGKARTSGNADAGVAVCREAVTPERAYNIFVTAYPHQFTTALNFLYNENITLTDGQLGKILMLVGKHSDHHNEIADEHRGFITDADPFDTHLLKADIELFRDLIVRMKKFNLLKEKDALKFLEQFTLVDIRSNQVVQVQIYEAFIAAMQKAVYVELHNNDPEIVRAAIAKELGIILAAPVAAPAAAATTDILGLSHLTASASADMKLDVKAADMKSSAPSLPSLAAAAAPAAPLARATLAAPQPSAPLNNREEKDVPVLNYPVAPKTFLLDFDSDRLSLTIERNARGICTLKLYDNKYNARKEPVLTNTITTKQFNQFNAMHDEQLAFRVAATTEDAVSQPTMELPEHVLVQYGVMLEENPQQAAAYLEQQRSVRVQQRNLAEEIRERELTQGGYDYNVRISAVALFDTGALTPVPLAINPAAELYRRYYLEIQNQALSVRNYRVTINQRTGQYQRVAASVSIAPHATFIRTSENGAAEIPTPNESLRKNNDNCSIM